MEPKPPKISRSARLTPEMFARLETVVGRLGVNMNAYISQAVGQAVARDELAYCVEKTSLEVFDQIKNLITSELSECKQLDIEDQLDR
jgi:hypothetical protein